MDMYFDLYLPFPTPRESLDVSKKKKGKGKGQESGGNQGPVSCWDGLDDGARADFSQQLALSGHREHLPLDHFHEPQLTCAFY